MMKIVATFDLGLSFPLCHHEHFLHVMLQYINGTGEYIVRVLFQEERLHGYRWALSVDFVQFS